MRIIAYTWEADVHCPHCTYKRFGRHILPQFAQDERPELCDSHGVVINATDREGNRIHPVFDIDEDPDGTFPHCGDCHEEL